MNFVQSSPKFRPFPLIIVILAIFLCIKFLLPLFYPFLLGVLLSVTAEPLVGFGCKKLHLRRAISAPLGVSIALLLTALAATVLGALALKEVKALAGLLPDLQETAQQGITTVRQTLETAVSRAPEGIKPVLERSMTNLLSDSEDLLSLPARKLPSLVGSLMGKVPGGALSVGTAVLCSYLFSIRLPRIKEYLRSRLPASVKKTWLPALRRIRQTLAAWLLAQGKLMLVTYAIVTLGLWISGISLAPAWAVLVTLVDAVPLLGTGIILVPWALVKLMQRAHFTAIGLLCTYAAAMLTRTVLEPRLVGKQLGIDPLVTLICLYAGYRIWGFAGLILAPIAASLGKNLLEKPSMPWE